MEIRAEAYHCQCRKSRLFHDLGSILVCFFGHTPAWVSLANRQLGSKRLNESRSRFAFNFPNICEPQAAPVRPLMHVGEWLRFSEKGRDPRQRAAILSVQVKPSAVDRSGFRRRFRAFECRKPLDQSPACRQPFACPPSANPHSGKDR